MTHTNNVNIPYLLLWLNGGCNARCQTCEIWRDTTKTFISAQEIRAMAEDWVSMGVREVELCGEPTLHPELSTVCEAIHSRGIAIRFLSNGLRLQKFASVIAKFGRSLTVSLDGPPSVHNLVRNVPQAYRQLERGISLLHELAPGLPVYGRCAVHRLNYRFLRETVDTAKSLGLTDISFIGLDVSSPAFGRDGLAPEVAAGVRSLAIARGELGELQCQVEGLIREKIALSAEPRFIRETPERLRSVLVDYFTELYSPSLGLSRVIRCNAPWTSAVIEPDGKVRPCWFLAPYGNLKDYQGGLTELLNSPHAVEYRDNIDVTRSPICRSCICPRTFDVSGTT